MSQQTELNVEDMHALTAMDQFKEFLESFQTNVKQVLGKKNVPVCFTTSQKNWIYLQMEC